MGVRNRDGWKGRVAELENGEAMVADEGQVLSIGRELGVVSGGGAGVADLDAGAVLQVIEKEAAA